MLYGLIGLIEAVPGFRDELAGLLSGIGSLPGCHHYIVAKDSEDPNLVWVTEVWESKGAHQASLELPAVQEAIGRGRPMIAGFRSQHEVHPVGRYRPHRLIGRASLVADLYPMSMLVLLVVLGTLYGTRMFRRESA